MKEEFGTLRSDTVIQVFKSSLSRRGTNRAEIAADVGSSVMTVGKAVDALVSLDILCQSHSADATPGRPARAIYPSRHKWIAVYEVSETLLSFYMLDLSLKVIDSFDYEPASTSFPDDEVKYFAHLARIFAASRRKSPECIACGILVPCKYDSEHDRLLSDSTFLSRIRPAAIFENYTFNRTPSIGNLRIFNTARIGSVLEDGTFAMILYLDRGDIKSALISTGSHVSSEIKLYNSGAFRLPGQKNLSELSMSDESIEAFCFELCELIITSVCSIGINTVILCGTLYDDIGQIRNAVGDIIYRRCADDRIMPPQIISCNAGEESAKGISEEIRNKWFYEEMIDTY